MTAYARLCTTDELLICLIRAVKNAQGMPVINESNLMATCDHLENLIAQARYQVQEAKKEISWYDTSDRMGGSF